MNKYEPANPDCVGYPHEQEDWWKYVDADTKYQADEQEKMENLENDEETERTF